MRTLTRMGGVVVALSVAALGCDKKGAAPAPIVAASPAPVGGAAVDPEVAKLVKAVIAGCKVDAQYVSVSECKNGELDAITTYAKEKQRPDFYLSLADLALTDGAKDPNVFAVVIAAINQTGWIGGYDWLKKNADKGADRFLELAAKLPDDQARGFGAMTAAIALTAGKRAQLDALLAKRTAGGTLRQEVLPHVLRWGGVEALPTVDGIAKTSTNADEKWQALWSVGVAVYSGFGAAPTPPLSDADRAKLCDWAKGFLKDPTAQAANGAASSMGRCGGAYIDAAIDALSARVTAATFNDAMAGALKSQCWGEGVVGAAANGSPAQCTRVMKLVDKVSVDKALSPLGQRSAAFVAWVVGKDGKLGKEAKTILARAAKSPDKGVADDAARYLKDFP